MYEVSQLNQNPIANQPLIRVEKITLRSHVSILPGALFIFSVAALAGFLIYARATSSWPFVNSVKSSIGTEP